jgi:hypothetical protein
MGIWSASKVSHGCAKTLVSFLNRSLGCVHAILLIDVLCTFIVFNYHCKNPVKTYTINQTDSPCEPTLTLFLLSPDWPFDRPDARPNGRSVVPNNFTTSLKSHNYKLHPNRWLESSRIKSGGLLGCWLCPVGRSVAPDEPSMISLCSTGLFWSAMSDSPPLHNKLSIWMRQGGNWWCSRRSRRGQFGPSDDI